MNRPHRFVSGLTGDEITTLNEIVKNHDSYHVRRRSPLLFFRVMGNPEQERLPVSAKSAVTLCLHG